LDAVSFFQLAKPNLNNIYRLKAFFIDKMQILTFIDN